jgi:hypothetical protein
VTLFRAGLAGARTNLESRIPSLTDVVYTAGVIDEIARLNDEATVAAAAAEDAVRVQPA